MAISFVGANDGSTTCAAPTHQAGDLFLCHVFRDGSNSTPTLPAGWTQLDTNTTNSSGAISGYKIAASSSETVGIWTNGTNLILEVYRGVDQTTPIGAHTLATGISTTVSYPALTMQVTDGTSWVTGMASHRSVDTSLETPPTGMTLRRSRLDAGDESAGHDTNGGVSSWSLQTVSVGGASSGWVGNTFEIRAATSNVAATPEKLSLNLITFEPSVSIGSVIAVPRLSLTLSSFAPSVSTPVTAVPSVLNLPISTYAPLVTATDIKIAIPSTKSLTLTAHAPTVLTPVLITVPAASITTARYSPQLQYAVFPSSISLTINTSAPGITITAPPPVADDFLTLRSFIDDLNLYTDTDVIIIRSDTPSMLQIVTTPDDLTIRGDSDSVFTSESTDTLVLRSVFDSLVIR